MVRQVGARRTRYDYVFQSQRFVCKMDFSGQYFTLYNNRLKELRLLAKRQAANLWSEENLTDAQLLEIKADTPCAAIGILVKRYALRPSVIDKYIVKVGVMSRPSVVSSFYSAEDPLYLEDESGRVVLDFHCEKPWQDLVTGIVLAVNGVMKANAVFEVTDFCFPEVDMPPRHRIVRDGNDEYIGFVSGLELGNNAYDPLLLHLLVQYFLGNLTQASREESAKILRLVVLGNSIYKPPSAYALSRTSLVGNEAQGKADLYHSIKDLDTILAELVSSIPVDIIPGEMDPTNISWPQQALNPYLFPHASRYSALQSAPNPYEFSLDGLKFLCTSGQNVSTLTTFSRPQSAIDVACNTLEWRHLAPLCPDYIPALIHSDDDPLIVHQLPNVYVVGNQPEFAHRVLSNGSRVVTVPKFSEGKHQLVLVNLGSLEATCVAFGSTLDTR